MLRPLAILRGSSSAKGVLDGVYESRPDVPAIGSAPPALSKLLEFLFRNGSQGEQYRTGGLSAFL